MGEGEGQAHCQWMMGMRIHGPTDGPLTVGDETEGPSHHVGWGFQRVAQTLSALPGGFSSGSESEPCVPPCGAGGGRSGWEAAGGAPDEGWE